jgi:hypothetical protein
VPILTEQLDADIKELDRRLSTRLDGLDSRLDNLDRSVTGLREEFAAFRGRMNVIIAILSGGVLLMFGSASMIGNGVLSLQRELGRNEAMIDNQGKVFVERSSEVRSIATKLDRLGEDLARLQGRLDGDAASPKSGK